MTPLGYIFLVVFAFILLTKRPAILLVSLSAPFFDSSLAEIGGFSVSPYALAVLIYLVASANGGIKNSGWALPSKKSKRTSLLLLSAFSLYSITFTFIAPGLFNGLGVVNYKLSGDAYNGAILTPLSYSTSNISQSAYLVLNTLFVLKAANSQIPVRKYYRVFLVTGVTTSLLVELYSRSISYAIHDLFDNSTHGFYATFDSDSRARGHFAEPSHLAVFALLALVFGILETRPYLVRIRKIYLVGGASLLLVMAGSTTAALAICILAVLAFAEWSRSSARNGFLHRPMIALMAALPVLAIFGPDVAKGVLSGKFGSSSWIIRTGQDSHSWSLFLETNGLGVGLGSNYASSLGLLLLSNIGIIGAVLYSLTITSVFSNRGNAVAGRASYWCLVSVLVCGLVSFADFQSPVFWFTLVAAIGHTWDSGLRAQEKAPQATLYPFDIAS